MKKYYHCVKIRNVVHLVKLYFGIGFTNQENKKHIGSKLLSIEGLWNNCLNDCVFFECVSFVLFWPYSHRITTSFLYFKKYHSLALILTSTKQKSINIKNSRSSVWESDCYGRHFEKVWLLFYDYFTNEGGEG